MSRNAVLRGAVHLVGPDLDLKGLSVAADKGCVEGLVHVGLWHGDVVFEPAGNGLIQLMDHPQGPVAVFNGIHDDPHGEHVVNLIQGLILLDHLFIDAEKMFYPPVHSGRDLRVRHVVPYFFHDVIDKCFSGFLI